MLSGLLSGLFGLLLSILLAALLALFSVLNFLFELIGGLLECCLGAAEGFGFAAEHSICGLFDSLLELLETVSGDLFSFLSLRPESSFGEHLSGFECFLGFLFADFTKGFVEAF